MGQSDDRYVIPARLSWWISDETSLDGARDQDDVNSLARVARSKGAGHGGSQTNAGTIDQRCANDDQMEFDQKIERAKD
jgi:hypothetical protein